MSPSLGKPCRGLRTAGPNPHVPGVTGEELGLLFLAQGLALPRKPGMDSRQVGGSVCVRIWVCVPSTSKCVCATVAPNLEHGRRSASAPTFRRRTRRRHHHHHHRRHRCDGKDGFESGEREEGILLSSGGCCGSCPSLPQSATSGPILSRALPPGYEIPSFPRQGHRQQTGRGRGHMGFVPSSTRPLRATGSCQWLGSY